MLFFFKLSIFEELSLKLFHNYVDFCLFYRQHLFFQFLSFSHNFLLLAHYVTLAEIKRIVLFTHRGRFFKIFGEIFTKFVELWRLLFLMRHVLHLLFEFIIDWKFLIKILVQILIYFLEKVVEIIVSALILRRFLDRFLRLLHFFLYCIVLPDLLI